MGGLSDKSLGCASFDRDRDLAAAARRARRPRILAEPPVARKVRVGLIARARRPGGAIDAEDPPARRVASSRRSPASAQAWRLR